MTAGDPPFDPYKTLQVDPEAEDEVVEAAYRRLARKYHPDVAGPGGEARMVALNRAWELLRDPAQRARVDRARAAAATRASWAPRASPGHSGPPAWTARTPAPGPPPAPPSPRDAARGPRHGTTRPVDQSGGSADPADPRWASSTGFDAFSDAVRGEAGRQRGQQQVPRDWTTGRSHTGSGYDPATMRSPDGAGAAGRPPGNPSGSVIGFGRYDGWSLGEIARTDLEYLEWLDRMPIGRAYQGEIDTLLRAAGRRRSAADEQRDRRGLFRR
jgi:curved DNA-binding protein CbpA